MLCAIRAPNFFRISAVVMKHQRRVCVKGKLVGASQAVALKLSLLVPGEETRK